MKWALIGVPALTLAAIGIGGPAEALPAAPAAANAVSRSAPALPAAYHRYRYRYRRAGESASAEEAGGVRTGQWAFTTRLEAFAPPPQSPGMESSQAPQVLSGSEATYLSCIQSDRPVPFQFDGRVCKLDSRDGQGSRISWSMTCTNSQGAVRSDGVAQYHGDTMDGTLVNHFPAGNGKMTDLTQRITGRYLGACPQVAQGAPTPPRPAAAPASPASPASAAPNAAQWVQPETASGGAKPSVASGSNAPSAAASGTTQPSAAPPREAASAAPAESPPPPRTRYVHHRRYYHHRYYAYRGGGWPGGGLFGIRIPFLGGL